MTIKDQRKWADEYLLLIDCCELKTIASAYIKNYLGLVEDFENNTIDGKKYADCINILSDFTKNEYGHLYLSAMVSATCHKLLYCLLRARLPNEKLRAQAIIIITKAHIKTTPFSNIDSDFIYSNIILCERIAGSLTPPEGNRLKKSINILNEHLATLKILIIK